MTRKYKWQIVNGAELERLRHSANALVVILDELKASHGIPAEVDLARGNLAADNSDFRFQDYPPYEIQTALKQLFEKREPEKEGA